MNPQEAVHITLAQPVLPENANPAGNIHGGDIMKMMDSAAGVAAQKYCHTNVVTARVNELNFKLPVYVGNLVSCHAQIIYTGFSSMEVFVVVEVEDLMTPVPPKIALTAFFTMVSLDDSGRPSQVAPLAAPSDPYSRKLYEEGKRRYLDGKRRMKQQENK